MHYHSISPTKPSRPHQPVLTRCPGRVPPRAGLGAARLRCAGGAAAGAQGGLVLPAQVRRRLGAVRGARPLQPGALRVLRAAAQKRRAGVLLGDGDLLAISLSSVGLVHDTRTTTTHLYIDRHGARDCVERSVLPNKERRESRSLVHRLAGDK